MMKFKMFFLKGFFIWTVLILQAFPCGASAKYMPLHEHIFQAEENGNEDEDSGSKQESGDKDGGEDKNENKENDSNSEEGSGESSEENSSEKTTEKSDEKNKEEDKEKNANGENTKPAAASEETEQTADNGEKENNRENKENGTGEENKTAAANLNPAKKIHAEVIHKFEGGVTQIETGQSSNYFFAAGEDGFITKYTLPSLTPDTWQISRLPIKKIAVHPGGKYIAVYESNGFSTHRVSLWEWASKKKVFAKHLSDSVTSLSWSGNGNYLFVGSRSLAGITVFNLSGVPQNIYSSAPGIVFLAATGEREKTIVTYGESGRLVYTDIAKRKKLAEYKTENKLENTCLIKNFTRIIGYKNNSVFVIDAASGKTLKEYPAGNAVFASKTSDTEPIWLERVNRKNEWILRKGTGSSPSFVLPRSFEVVSAKYLNSSIIIGGKNGKLLILKTDSSKTEITSPLEYNSIPASDIASCGDILFFIAKNKIYSCTSPSEPVSVIAENIDSNCITCCEGGFILWSDNKRAPVYYLSERDKKKKIIFRPKEAVISLSVYGNTVSTVESFGDVSMIDIQNGSKIFSYNAAGIQSALQIDKDRLLISKSSAGKALAPVFELNILTKETTPVTLHGDLVLSLTRDFSAENSFFCFLLNSLPSDRTSLVRFKLRTGKLENLLTYEDEDLEAFITPVKDGAVTNFGKENLIFFNTRTKQGFKIQRDSSLSKKAVSTKDFMLSLNFDGSLSWYDSKTMEFIKNVRYGNKS